MSDHDTDYPVGYGKPPQHTRFHQGQSGNPRGRPKGSRNLSTLMAKALNEPVVISENGKRKRITKREAVLKQLVNKAASGDAKAIQLLLGEIRQLEGREPPSAESVLFDEADRELISQLYDRLRGSRSEGSEGTGASDDAKPSSNSGSEP
jgi:Family of unknown function (DUF5681)